MIVITSLLPTALPFPTITFLVTSQSPVMLMLTPRKGTPGEEGQDYGYKFTNARRRSNSSSHGHDISNFKTKFETVESEPMFEEDYHGPQDEDMEEEHMGLEKAESADSTSMASVEEEEHAKKA
ncbi:MAG: hypothetical protein LQ343_006313 [Gyalolechia ehrenbergii]|nr:MAG: hypothetical protein LQ343_006313 [Gyalolechia ehrenbergii]